MLLFYVDCDPRDLHVLTHSSPPLRSSDLAYSLLTRSQRVSHENLRLRDPEWLADVERWLEEQAMEQAHETPSNTASAKPMQPMFPPYRLRELAIPTRIVVSPILTYAAGNDGVPTDFHMVHYGARAMGGAGPVSVAMTARETAV